MANVRRRAYLAFVYALIFSLDVADLQSPVVAVRSGRIAHEAGVFGVGRVVHSQQTQVQVSNPRYLNCVQFFLSNLSCK